MMKKWVHLLVLAILLSGCSMQQQGPNYDEMKKMMTDALQTEDGKKAIRKMLSDPEFRELMVLEQPEVKKSIEDTLLSDKGKEFWKHAFEDPKFSEVNCEKHERPTAGHYEKVNERLFIPKRNGGVFRSSRYAKAAGNHFAVSEYEKTDGEIRRRDD